MLFYSSLFSCVLSIELVSYPSIQEFCTRFCFSLHHLTHFDAWWGGVRDTFHRSWPLVVQTDIDMNESPRNVCVWWPRKRAILLPWLLWTTKREWMRGIMAFSLSSASKTHTKHWTSLFQCCYHSWSWKRVLATVQEWCLEGFHRRMRRRDEAKRLSTHFPSFDSLLFSSSLFLVSTSSLHKNMWAHDQEGSEKMRTWLSSVEYSFARVLWKRSYPSLGSQIQRQTSSPDYCSRLHVLQSTVSTVSVFTACTLSFIVTFLL